MKYSTNVGIFDYDWDNLITELSKQTPGTVAPHTGLGYDENGELEIVTRPDDLAATHAAWHDAGYKVVNEGGSAEWHMYYPGLNFDEQLQKDYMEFMGIEQANACWISAVEPGFCCPWHIDQHEIRSMGKRRYHTHIGKPHTGHVFMIEDEYYIDQPQGTTFQWNDPFLWHAGFNGGRVKKWLLNFI